MKQYQCTTGHTQQRRCQLKAVALRGSVKEDVPRRRRDLARFLPPPSVVQMRSWSLDKTTQTAREGRATWGGRLMCHCSLPTVHFSHMTDIESPHFVLGCHGEKVPWPPKLGIPSVPIVLRSLIGFCFAWEANCPRWNFGHGWNLRKIKVGNWTLS